MSDSLRQSGAIVTLRVTRHEQQQLLTLARREGDTLSGLIREALYLQFGVGGFGACNSLTTRAGNTPD